MTSSHQSNCRETLTVQMTIEIKDETTEYKSLSSFVWEVGDPDRIRPLKCMM